jgi:hypothetical protein
MVAVIARAHDLVRASLASWPFAFGSGANSEMPPDIGPLGLGADDG